MNGWRAFVQNLSQKGAYVAVMLTLVRVFEKKNLYL